MSISAGEKRVGLPPRLFGSSGIRRIADQQLVDLAYKVGVVTGEQYGNIVIGGDTRVSTPTIKKALFNGIKSSGALCLDAGLLPTPTLAYTTRHFSTGVMVTASHNPPEYNGIKFWNPDGAAFDDAQETRAEGLINSNKGVSAFNNGAMKIPKYEGAVNGHLNRILNNFIGSLGRVKVVIDCGGGAGSVITPNLMQKMGTKAVLINCQPSGTFPRASEPTDTSLKELKQKVVATKARIGLAHDGDADRLIVVNDRGEIISGDKLLIVLAHYLKVKEVVTTVDASMTIEESGLTVKRTRVGDSAVSSELKRTGIKFGGEPCGAWIFPSISYCPDGIHAAALVAVLATETNLTKLVDDIPSYPMLRGSLRYYTAPDIYGIEKSLMALNPGSLDKTDGLKCTFKNGWLLIRFSGTEPKIRLTVEAKSETEARRIYEQADQLIKTALVKQAL
ncbi:MAG: phosphoglucosamine mutase [Dehalogenimonas sp.]